MLEDNGMCLQRERERKEGGREREAKREGKEKVTGAYTALQGYYDLQ